MANRNEFSAHNNQHCITFQYSALSSESCVFKIYYKTVIIVFIFFFFFFFFFFVLFCFIVLFLLFFCCFFLFLFLFFSFSTFFFFFFFTKRHIICSTSAFYRIKICRKLKEYGIKNYQNFSLNTYMYTLLCSLYRKSIGNYWSIST